MPSSLTRPLAAPEPQTIDALLTERYGAGRTVEAIDNAIIRHILRHRSVRAFSPQDLPERTLATLIAAAQSASTSSNLQAWSVVAVQDAAHKDRLAVWANDQDFVRQAPLFLVWLADLSRVRRVARPRDGVEIDGTDYLESVILASIDAALAAQNAVLAAESLGLGVVYAGAIRSHVRPIARDLGLPPYVFPVFGTAIGYPAEAAVSHIRPRLAQAAVLHHEHYNADIQPQAAEHYDEVLDAFWDKQNISHQPWTQNLTSRLGNVGRKGDARYELGSILRELGFPLR